MEITFHAIIQMCTFKTALYDVEIFAEFKRGQKFCPAAALCRVEGREARPLWVPISASLKSFRSASGEIPFSAKYTERCFTRVGRELKSC